MKFGKQRCARDEKRASAFTLVEVMMGLAVLGIMILSLYSALAFGFNQANTTRQEERATQILSERMEVVRLLSWAQVTNLSGYIPTTFTDAYYSSNPTNPASGWLVYTGAVTVSVPSMTETYSNNLRMIQISLTWTSGSITHNRQMTTFVSSSGLQGYVY